MDGPSWAHRNDGHRPERSPPLTANEEGRARLSSDTLIVVGALLLASVLAWWWLAAGAGMGEMSTDGMPMSMPGMAMDMPGMAGMQPLSWTPAYAGSVFVMWTIMMVAMMLPSALPMMLFYTRVAGRQETSGTVPHAFVFASAYVAVWAGFSALATGLQWVLTDSGLVTDAMRFGDRLTGGVLLIAAGLYQLTPLKRLCLAHCRAPLAFLLSRWRPGYRGAFGMGLRHGGYCVGCCWFVMALLFVGGVMNLAWVVALAAFVLAEKLLPFGQRVGQIAGIIAIAAGGYFVAT